MDKKLDRFKYTASCQRAKRTPRQSQPTPASSDQPSPTESLESVVMTAENIKVDILETVRGEISKIIREELKCALADDFDALKSELRAVRSEIANTSAAIRSEINQMKADIQDVTGGLSTWSDEMASLQTTVTSLQSQVVTLKDKCEDMEGRMRRGNIRIVGVDEQPNSSTPDSVSKMLKEVLQLDRVIKIDRSHRTLGPRVPGDRERPRVIIAKLHYDGDAAEILRRARDRAPLMYNGKRIAIFPDYTSNVARARAAFTDVRKELRGRKGVRYGLFYPARLRITFNNQDKEFVDPKKAMEYVKKLHTEPGD